MQRQPASSPLRYSLIIFDGCGPTESDGLPWPIPEVRQRIGDTPILALAAEADVPSLQALGVQTLPKTLRQEAWQTIFELANRESSSSSSSE